MVYAELQVGAGRRKQQLRFNIFELPTPALNFWKGALVSLRKDGDGINIACNQHQSMTPRIDTEKLVTVPQAAKLLKITPAAIYKTIKRGRLPYLKLGGVFLIHRADLIKYRKSKSVGGRPKKQK